MPGRVIQDPDDIDEFLTHFGVKLAPEVWENRYNLAPSEYALCIMPNRTARELKWGLIPHWERDTATAKKPINARSETVAEKKTFREAFELRRCILPLTGWYEWTPGKLRKQPHCIRPAHGKPFGFAAIYEFWESKFGDTVDSFTVLTCEPNKKMAKIHHRMGCILAPADYDAWLDPVTSISDLQAMLHPAPNDWMKHFPVSTKVSKASYKGADCVKPEKMLFGEPEA